MSEKAIVRQGVGQLSKRASGIVQAPLAQIVRAAAIVQRLVAQLPWKLRLAYDELRSRRVVVASLGPLSY